MKTLLYLAALGMTLSASDQPVISGDSDRGARLFENEQCVRCHSVNGRGGKMGLDLARAAPRGYSPAHLASSMWNHAPVMWAAMQSVGIQTPQLTPQGAADLFAYLYSKRFFDRAGDAGRGKHTFEEKHCASCHGVKESLYPGAPPVENWESLADPVLLVQQMWNHSYRMHDAFAKRRLEWQALTADQLTDILAYLGSLPETKHLAQRFSNTSGEGGDQIFARKGCINCHKGNLALENRLKNLTLVDIAVDMWNHAPRMLRPPPSLTPGEMRQLLSYLWMRQFVYPGGNIAAGKQVFAARQCASCHVSGKHGAPPLPGQARAYSEVTIISALWRHGPQMLNRMKEAGVGWPQFQSPQEVVDLIAYLNSVQ